MVMLTELLRFAVVDENRRRAPVADFCVALLEDDYPPVTHLLFDHDGKSREVAWKRVSQVDIARREIIPSSQSSTVSSLRYHCIWFNSSGRTDCRFRLAIELAS